MSGQVKEQKPQGTRAADELLRCLVSKCRCMTIQQCARVLQCAEESAKKRVRDLEKSGLIETFQMMVHPELMLSFPALDWELGRAGIPDFGAIAWALKARWKESPKQSRIAVATKSAQTLLGGHCGGRRPRVREAAHDIHVTSVYLWYREYQPDLESGWVPEDEFTTWEEHGSGKIADAIVFSASGHSEDNIIIDFGGWYSKRKLQRLHDEYAPICRYQIW